MLNKDLFLYDPTQRSIPNDGVAKIGSPEDEKQWDTLRFELEHFVCEGQYEAGLDRILDGYLKHMDQAEQPAVWVSGFYGSGKSHFLRVLENLWNDPQLPDGASARGVTHLSERVALHLRELDTLGKRSGGLWAAAGTLGAGAAGSVRLAFMGILFAAAGLPTNYAAAKLLLWLKQESAEETVRATLEAAGRSLEKELRNMYVSTHLGEALLTAVPGFATTPAEALKQVREGHAQVEDIDNDELCDTMRDVLNLIAAKNGKPGHLPCTLIIMDELQQYLGDDIERADKVLRIVEAVTSKFGSQVLFVASGQSAMGSTPGLLRLQDRFTGRVEFTDTDVDRVVRQVILQKAPDKSPLLEGQLTEVSGEISRHLQGTKIGPTPDDAKTMGADYPLLPTRRRFWEVVLRAIDRGGSAAQLRTQLRSVQEATKFVAELNVGVVVPGDFLYEQQVNGMLHSGVLSKEIHEKIEGLRDGSVDGGLKFRLAALVFLIGQLNEVNKDLGVRANANTLADLLIANLNDGSAMLRTEVEQTLAALVEAGVLQPPVEGEYSLQGRIGTEWQQDYQQRVNRVKDETARVAAVRSAKLQEALQRHVGNLAFAQGEGRVPRKGQFVYGLEAPDLTTGQIPVWVRDEWSVGSMKAAQDEAAARGSEDPVVHLLIPKRDAQAIKDEIVKLEAAQETLDARVAGGTEEGAAARAGIQARRDAADEQLRRLMSELVTQGRVFMSGGNELREADLKGNVDAGLKAAAQRMFPKFAVAEGNWGLVVQRALQGSGTALEVLGWEKEATSQPVCAEVLRFLGSAGKRGAEVRDHFKSAPYGWSQDAVDGSLLVLARADAVRVTLNGASATASEVTQDKLGKYTFAPEHGPVLTAEQKLQLKKLFADAAVPCPPGQEPEALGSFISQLIAAGHRAGGQPPRPVVPNLQQVRDIEALSGNERLVAAWEARESLASAWVEWHRAGKEIERRMGDWGRLETLVSKGSLLPEAAETRTQMKAIVASRSLLAEPDPVRPLIATMVDSLRAAILARHAEYKAARERGVAELEAVDEFKALPAETWKRIVAECGIGPLPELELATESDVLAELDVRPLGMWQDLIEGMKGRIDAARLALAREVSPKEETVPYTVPSRRLTSPAEVDDYLAEIRQALLEALETGPVIIQR